MIMEMRVRLKRFISCVNNRNYSAKAQIAVAYGEKSNKSLQISQIRCQHL